MILREPIYSGIERLDPSRDRKWDLGSIVPDDFMARLPSRVQRASALTGICLLSAAILAAAQTVQGCGWLIFLGLIPALLVINPRRFLAAWITLGFVYGAYTLFTCYWVGYYEEGRLIPALLVGSVYGALFFSLPAVCCWAVRTPSAAPRLLVLPAAWVLAELAQRHFLLRTSWALLGQPLAEWPPLVQWACLGGPESQSYLVVSTNVAITLHLRACPRPARILGLLQGPGLLLLTVVLGGIRLGTAVESDSKLRVALIQPNVSPMLQWKPSYRQTMLAHFDRLIDRTIGQQPDLIILPESALAGFVCYERELTDWALNTVARAKCPVVFGSHDRTGTELFNIAVIFQPSRTATVYHKNHLVPIAEYIPNVGPFRQWIISMRGNPLELTPGSAATLFRTADGVAFGTMICFEDIFPDLAREFASSGAGFLVAIVNTAHFRDSCQAWQHLRRAQLTAISVGLPLVRCSNGGISCVIDGNGCIRSILAGNDGKVVMVEGAEVFSLPLAQTRTLYRRFGDLLPATAFGLVTIAGISWSLVLSRRSRRH